MLRAAVVKLIHVVLFCIAIDTRPNIQLCLSNFSWLFLSLGTAVEKIT